MYCDFPELGRCCFCMPLRRGVLTFGYVNILFSFFMIGVYSFCVHTGSSAPHLIYHGSVTSIASEACLVVYCLEVIFNGMLLYGAHLKILLYVKVYYYFAITSTVATVLVQVLNVSNMWFYYAFEYGAMAFAGLCLQLYLIILVRSLVRKLEMDAPHLYENPLNQIVSGERKIENEIYNTSTVIPNNV